MSVNNNVLVVDAGNTAIKWALFNADYLVWQGREDELELSLPESVDAIYFASVRSEGDNQPILQRLACLLPEVPVLALASTARACAVTNGYLEPHRLGIDRWLAVLAVYHQYRQAVVLVDAGTAIKVDFVDAGGQHLGGYIVPGRNLMERSLVLNTGRIRYTEADMHASSLLPNNTGLAVRLGCDEMVLGFLQRILQRFPNHQYVFTGGDGELLMEQLKIEAVYDGNLVLQGAKLLGDEWMSNG